MEKSPLFEAIKEAGRYAIFMAVSVFVSVLLDKLNALQQNDTMILVLTLILRIADKYLHEKRKESGYLGETRPAGLLPF